MMGRGENGAICEADSMVNRYTRLVSDVWEGHTREDCFLSLSSVGSTGRGC